MAEGSLHMSLGDCEPLGAARSAYKLLSLSAGGGLKAHQKLMLYVPVPNSSVAFGIRNGNGDVGFVLLYRTPTFSHRPIFISVLKLRPGNP